MAKDYAGAATGALSGASAGAIFGGPIGAVAGGLIGGTAGLFGGGRKKKKKLSTFDKRQQQLNAQQHQGILGEGPLADLYNYDPESANAIFDQIQARPAQRNFAENTVPSITGAFRNNGLQNSSYLGDSLSKAGRDVQENLDALRAKYLYSEQSNARDAKRNAVENLQNRKTFGYDLSPGANASNLDSILGSINPQSLNELFKYFNNNKVNISAGES